MADRFYSSQPAFLAESDSEWPLYNDPSPHMVPLLERETFDDLPHLSFDESAYSSSPSESSCILDQLDDLVSYSLSVTETEPRGLAHSMSTSDLAEFGLRTKSSLGRRQARRLGHHASSSFSSFHIPNSNAMSSPPSSSHSMGCLGRKDSMTVGRAMAFAATPCMPYEEEEERYQWRMHRQQSKRSATSTSSSGKSYRLKRKVSGQIGRIFRKVFT